MNTQIKKLQWIACGLIATLVTGTPAVADDTELLLLTPQGQRPKPNVLFIVDSSGSMDDQVNTRKIYDSNTTYPIPSNGCDPNTLYWTEVDIVPSCDPANTRRIAKSSFVCQDSAMQMAGIGRYTGVMAQYRDGSSGIFSFLLGLDATRWQKLEQGNTTDLVECAKDLAKHGDGSTPDRFYPQKGGDVDQFTSDPDLSVDWGSWPTSQTVTVWDGNYLNYLLDPTFVDESKINIVKQVSEVVLNAVTNVNVAVMRFDGNDGGAVIQTMSDLDTNRTEIINTIKNINNGGNTPLSETLYEAALYWRGMPAAYGADNTMTDQNSLKFQDPDIYAQPEFNVCARNFNIVLTDGVPTEDTDTPGLVDDLPEWGSTLGYSACTGTIMGHCLDDLAAYLYNADIAPTEDGLQQVITNTIGFDIDLDILEETAARGSGTYFQADDVETLTISLLDIVSDVTDRTLSFAAPAVAVNSFNRTQNLNDLYMTTFAAQNKTRWPGNVKKYRIKDSVIVDKNGVPAVNNLTGFFYDTAQSYWSANPDGQSVVNGGAVENLPSPAARKLYTDNVSGVLTATGNSMTAANDDSFTLADFGLTGSPDEPSIAELIRFARGEDVRDEDDDDETTDQRKWMGDPLHSQPAAVVYGGTEANPDVVIFAATNDGNIHAIDASNGQEIWSFIPKQHLTNLLKLYFDPFSNFKSYGVDGDIVPVVADRDDDGVIEPADGDFVHIVFGMRRGGNAFYSLDVTNRNSPKVNWRLETTAFGQSWSRPTIARLDVDASNFSSANVTDKAVVIIGGGYDPVHDTIAHPETPDASGAGIYMLDLHTGDIIWRAGPDGGAQLTLDPTDDPGLSRSIVSQVRVIDIDGDGFADRMYAADLGGQVLRFDIFKGKDPDGIGEDALVTGGVVAQLGAEGLASPTNADTRRFYTAPDVSVFNDNIQNQRFIAISLGSGYRAHPLDNTPVEKFFSLRDKAVFVQLTQDQYDDFDIIKLDDLVEVSGQVGAVIGASKRGWQFTLPEREKVLSTSVTFNNEVFFIGFSPDNAAAATCSAGVGKNVLYRVSVVNGDPIPNNLDGIVEGQEDAARVTELRQGGIAPSPRFLFPSPDDPDCTGDACSPPPLGCVGVECFDPGFENFPVRTLWTQDGIE